MIDPIIAGIGIAVLLGFIGNVLFQKTSIPNTLWLLLFGIALGALGIAGREFVYAAASFVSTIAVIVILSDGGMHLNLQKVAGEGFSAWLLMLTGITATALASIAILMAFGYPWEIALLIAIIVAGTSSSVVIPIVTSVRNVSEKLRTILSLESIADNFSIVIALVLIDFLAANTLSTEIVNTLVTGSLKEFFSALAIAIVFGLALTPIITRLEKYDFAYSAVFGTLVLVYTFSELLGSNGAITVFFSGIMLANSPVILNVLLAPKKYSPLNTNLRGTHTIIAFLIRSLFFVFLGMYVGLPEIGFLAAGLAVTIGFIIARFFYITVLSATKILDFSRDEKLLAAIMVPRGLSAAVLGVIAFSAGIPFAHDVVQIVLSVILFSVVFTTAGIYFLKGKEVRMPEPRSTHLEIIRL